MQPTNWEVFMYSGSILIVDDHPIYRDALCEKLTNDFKSAGVEVLSVPSVEDALLTISRGNKSWLVLLDLLLPNHTPLEAIELLKANNHVVHVIAMSGLDEQEWRDKCVESGASLFISKNNTSNFIYSKLCELLNIASLKSDEQQNFSLTARQLEVLALMSKGLANKIIADQLSISEQTVKIHINAIFKYLKVSNRTQAVYKANLLRLI